MKKNIDPGMSNVFSTPPLFPFHFDSFYLLCPSEKNCFWWTGGRDSFHYLKLGLTTVHLTSEKKKSWHVHKEKIYITAHTGTVV